MKIRLTIEGQVHSASLVDNPTSRDFLALLPLTLELEDYNATEKIAMLSSKLSSAEAPAGIMPSVGDITYYAPWGNVALFYKDFRYSKGLISLGRMEGDLTWLRSRGPLKALIEREPEPAERCAPHIKPSASNSC